MTLEDQERSARAKDSHEATKGTKKSRAEWSCRVERFASKSARPTSTRYGVIPAKAGIHFVFDFDEKISRDSRFHGNDVLLMARGEVWT